MGQIYIYYLLSRIMQERYKWFGICFNGAQYLASMFVRYKKQMLIRPNHTS